MGADTLIGGDGSDTFVFSSLWESSSTAPDKIVDLQNSDKIDLRAIDANTKIAGDQAFHIAAAFTGAGAEATMTFDAAHDRTVLSLDNNGDKVADMTIYLGGQHLDFSNWLW